LIQVFSIQKKFLSCVRHNKFISILKHYPFINVDSQLNVSAIISIKYWFM